MKTMETRKDWAIALISAGLAILKRDEEMGRELGEKLMSVPHPLIEFYRADNIGGDDGIEIVLKGFDENRQLVVDGYWTILTPAGRERMSARSKKAAA